MPAAISKLPEVLSRWLKGKPPTKTLSSDLIAPDVGAPTVNALPVFNEQEMLASFGHNQTLAKMVIESAIHDVTTYLSDLEQAIISKDWTVAQRSVHTMKSLFAQIGGSSLASHLKDVEFQLRNGGTIDAKVLATLRDEYATFKDALKMWIA